MSKPDLYWWSPQRLREKGWRNPPAEGAYLKRSPKAPPRERLIEASKELLLGGVRPFSDRVFVSPSFEDELIADLPFGDGKSPVRLALPHGRVTVHAISGLGSDDFVFGTFHR